VSDTALLFYMKNHYLYNFEG